MKVLFLIGFGVLSPYYIKNLPSKISSYSNGGHSIEKIEAFEILNTKCNVCHTRQNRKKIFTLDNMDHFAPKIHELVFIKKRMPKGKKNKLTEIDRAILKNWLNLLNIK